jgi:hypothetical protein
MLVAFMCTGTPQLTEPVERLQSNFKVGRIGRAACFDPLVAETAAIFGEHLITAPLDDLGVLHPTLSGAEDVVVG